MARASWRGIWQNLIPRADYPKGAGYVRSTFQIARSEPSSEEETWSPIQPLSENANGACDITYNQVYVGEHEDQYRPAIFGLMGPPICQDEFTMAWKAPEFWEKYFSAMEKRNVKSHSNRLANVYRQYAYKASANEDFHYVVGKWQGVQPPPSIVDMTDYTTGTLGLPNSELTQEHLDGTAQELMEEGADEGDTDAWISQGEDGPEWPLHIGSWMSKRLFLNNSELRADVNASFNGYGNLNPVIQRLGAKRVLGNFRHIINRFPARWIYVPVDTEVNYTATGLTSNTGTVTTYVNSIGAESTNPANTPVPDGTPILLRIPSMVNSTASFDVTKGRAGVVNGVWRDPNVTVVDSDDSGVASFEGVEVLNPMAMTEEVLVPVNSMPGMPGLTAQNYFGEWKFVTGNDAFLGIDGCTGITDPLHKKGRHFGEYRAAWRPAMPIFARFILFKRCPQSWDTVTCT